MSERDEKAADDFLALGRIDGEVIARNAMEKLLGVLPREDGLSVKENDKRAFAFMSAVEGLRRELQRRGHDLQAAGKRGGYRLVPFHERPRTAIDDGKRAVAAAISKTIGRLRSIPNPEQLTTEARYTRDAGLLRFGYLRAVLGARDGARPKAADAGDDVF